ncbi:MAG: hypothetical protein ACK5N8_06850 [Alphaproteobacteria bacterium]
MEKELVVKFILKAQEAKKEIDEVRNKIKSAKEEIKSSFVAKAGGLVAGLVSIKAIKDVYQETLKLSQVSEAFNLPVEQVSKFSNLLSMLGGDSSEAVSALESLGSAIDDYRAKGQGALVDTAGRVNISLFKKDGGVKNQLDLLRDLRGQLGKMRPDQQRTILKDMGIYSVALLRYIRASNEEFNKAISGAEKMGVITEGIKDTTIRTQVILSRLRQSFFMFGAALLGVVEPVLNKIMYFFDSNTWETIKRNISDLFSFMRNNIKKGDDFLRDAGKSFVTGFLESSPKLITDFLSGVKMIITDIKNLSTDWIKYLGGLENILSKIFIFFKAIGSVIGDITRWASLIFELGFGKILGVDGRTISEMQEDAKNNIERQIKQEQDLSIARKYAPSMSYMPTRAERLATTMATVNNQSTTNKPSYIDNKHVNITVNESRDGRQTARNISSEISIPWSSNMSPVKY